MARIITPAKSRTQAPAGAGMGGPSPVGIPAPQTYVPPASGGDGPAATQPAGPSEQERADANAAARDQAQRNWEDARAAASAESEKQQAIAAIKTIFSSYGLSSLYNKIAQYVQQGYNADTVQLMLRETPEYKARFPAMDALNAKKRGITEAEYINYEKTTAEIEQRYGLPKDMLMNNVTNLLTNEVSASELNDRVVLASANSLQAPEDLKKTLTDYYSIGSGGLTAYFLDPVVAMPLLEKQVATARIGTEAARQGIGIDVMGASNLQELGVSQEQAQAGFKTVAESAGLSAGAGDIATQKELIAGTLGGDTEAKKKIERAIGGKLGKFQGGGEFLQTQQGTTGLGSAATR